jgi:hypothetical protein
VIEEAHLGDSDGIAVPVLFGTPEAIGIAASV